MPRFPGRAVRADHALGGAGSTLIWLPGGAGIPLMAVVVRGALRVIQLSRNAAAISPVAKASTIPVLRVTRYECRTSLLMDMKRWMRLTKTPGRCSQ